MQRPCGCREDGIFEELSNECLMKGFSPRGAPGSSDSPEVEENGDPNRMLPGAGVGVTQAGKEGFTPRPAPANEPGARGAEVKSLTPRPREPIDGY